jgi:deazaflavin-dependent oxidoreductase (nitroreductase family)
MDLTTINRHVIAQFRAGGEIDGMHRDRLLLLTTTGRHTGNPHTTPMMFHRDGNRILVIASAAGAPSHPQWYLNLLANPLVTVEVGTEQYQARATDAGEEREHLWTIIKQHYPFFADHEVKATPRTIPVVILERTE